MAAVTTFDHAGAGSKTPRITATTTGRASEAFRPPHPFQVSGAGRLIGEQPLKLQQGPRTIHHTRDLAAQTQPVSTG
jgi:hypothetical protein